jgi:hypothetical protein
MGTLAVGLAMGSACESHRVMDPEQPCLEAGYAISSRTYDCTDDDALANERFEHFRDELACIPHELDDNGNIPVRDLFHCGYVIRTLSCDEVDAFGDDLTAWMSVSPACPLVAEYADGSPLPRYDGFEPADDGPMVSDPVCSDAQGPPVQFSVTNRTPSVDLALYWLRGDSCTEQYYAPLRFGEVIEQQSYEGHVWVVRDPSTDRLYDWFVAEDGLVVTVP